MPCFRGIELLLVSDADRLPEYPHPDGSSVRLLGLEELRQSISSRSQQPPSSPVHGRDSIQLQKDNPRVSVYIPTATGYQFSVKYSFNHVPASPCKYVFFKLSMNGRSITSWGVDPSDRPTGSVVRSLWKPSERWQDEIGIEGRSFLFMQGQEQERKSIADDGGLVEIQVFRAKDRRPRALKLEQFRNQEMYGIAAPSIGLLERPEDATFYEWHLIDPKDSPYATFRFHYRSWDNLVQLNLIPPGEMNIPLAGLSNTVGQNPKDDRGADISAGQTQEPFAFGIDTLDGSVFLDKPEERDRVEDSTSGRMTPQQFFLRHAPPLLPVSTFNRDFPQPSKAIRDGGSAEYLQRPLPEPPRDEAKDSFGSSSETSETPSLSPSIAEDVDNGLFENDIEVGKTEVVRYTKVTLKHKGEPEASPPVTVGHTPVSTSDYDASPSSTDSPHDLGAASPGAYLVSTGSLLEQHLRSTIGPNLPGTPQGPSPNVRHSLLETAGNRGSRSRFGFHTITESEWMSRTPSPIRHAAPGGSLFSKMWSPRPQRKSAKEFFAGLRKDKNGSGASRDISMGSVSAFGDENCATDHEVKCRTGG